MPRIRPQEAAVANSGFTPMGSNNHGTP